jgi:hypothetical protein
MPKQRSLADSPLWTNILLRTLLYYCVLGAVMYWLRDVSVGGLGFLSSEELPDLVASSKRAAAQSPGLAGPAVVPTIMAMFSAFAFTLPVVWIYTLTRKKKGWDQSVVQTLLVLPVIVAGIVVLVKHSLALAFGLSAIVAAVKFKNSLDDTKDAAYVLITIGIGLAAGVNPPVAAVLSVAFNLLVVGLWYTDFGRTPAALEGKLAKKQLERVMEQSNRTGTFVAMMDDEVFKSLSPEQLNAIAERAWRRRKKLTAEEEGVADAAPDEHEHLLCLKTAEPDQLRASIEPQFAELFARWRFGDIVHEDDGLDVVEYWVDFAETVTPGVVSDTLRSTAGPLLVRLELK